MEFRRENGNHEDRIGIMKVAREFRRYTWKYEGRRGIRAMPAIRYVDGIGGWGKGGVLIIRILFSC